jgi:hypothetical protein
MTANVAQMAAMGDHPLLALWLIFLPALVYLLSAHWPLPLVVLLKRLT